MISGINTSIDINLIVEQMVAQASTPLTRYQSQLSAVQSKQSALTAVQTKLASFESILYDFTTVGSSSVFASKEAESSDEDVTTVSATSSALTGVYNLKVNWLAAQHKLASDQFTDDTLEISAAEGAGTSTFRITVNGENTDVSVDVAAGEDNETVLSNIAQAINSSDAEVTAIVVNETSDTARLVVTSNNTGEDYEISFQDTSGSLLFNSGVIDGVGAVNNELAQARNASFTVDTLSFSRSTNVIDDAISGATLSLLSAGDSTVTVSQDEDTIKSDIKEFISAYNDVVGTINLYTSYNTDTNTASTLTNETLVKRIPNELRSLATGIVSGQPAAVNSLFQIGIEVDTDGTMSIADEAKLDQAIEAYPDDLAALFNTTDTGVAERLDNYLDNILDAQGMMSVRLNSINERIDDLNDNIEDFGDYLEDLQDTLYLRWANIEALMNANQTTYSYLANLMPAASSS